MFWMVYVEGRREPRKKHPSLELAHAEAERLACLPENIGKKVWVLVTIGCCELPTGQPRWTYFYQ